MHESGPLRDLMRRAESEAAAAGGSVTALHFRVGVLSAITSGSLEAWARHYAEETWGHVPEISIEESADPTDPHALGVSLVSMRIGD